MKNMSKPLANKYFASKIIIAPKLGVNLTAEFNQMRKICQKTL